MNPQVLTMTRSACLPLGHQREPVLGQEPEHALGIDQVLGAAQADEADGGLGLVRLACTILHRSRNHLEECWVRDENNPGDPTTKDRVGLGRDGTATD